MVWPILISVAAAPGKNFRLSAYDAVAKRSPAARIAAFTAFVCRPSCIVALPIAAVLALDLAIARPVARKQWRDGGQHFPFWQRTGLTIALLPALGKRRRQGSANALAMQLQSNRAVWQWLAAARTAACI